jgi:hypothetical protein
VNRAGLLIAPAVVGLWATSVGAANLRPEDAVSHIGETATVCGVVVSAEFEANARSQPTSLDLGQAYPHAIFTAVIYGVFAAPRRPQLADFRAHEPGERPQLQQAELIKGERAPGWVCGWPGCGDAWLRPGDASSARGLGTG